MTNPTEKTLKPSERLFVHGVTAQQWATRFGIEPVTADCASCGREKTTTLPFAQGQLRGLQAPPCPCGDDNRAPYCIVRDPKHGDLLDGDFQQ